MHALHSCFLLESCLVTGFLTAFSNSLSGNGEVSLHDVTKLSRSPCIQEGWQYYSLVDIQLGVKLDSSLLYLNVYHLVVHAYFLDQVYIKVCI